MKKIMMLLVAVMLVAGFTGQAMAAFGDGDLVRVVYSSAGTLETATDLGSVANLTAASTANVIYNTNNFDLSALGTGATAANSYVAYFSLTLTPNPKNQAWLSGPTGGQSVAKNNWSAFGGAEHSVTGLYYATGGGTGATGSVPSAAQVSVLMSNPASFWSQLTLSGAGVGQMAGYANTSAVSSLANLATVGYVDQTLYYYGSPSGLGTATGLNVATIRTYANGTTQLNPTVPIPAAIYLLGSGLLGLVGIRRKMAA